MGDPGDERTAAAGGHGPLRASHADREQVIESLKDAFVAGRLTRDELDVRTGQALAARTYAELAALTTDIPPACPPRPSARPTNRPPRTHPVRNAAIGSVSCLTVAAATFLYGLSLDDHTSSLFLVLTFLALIAVPCIIGNAAITSWQQRHPRRQLPPRPGQGGQAPAVQRNGSTGHDLSLPGAGTDQTRADLRAHRSRQDRPRPCGRKARTPRGIRPVPDAV